MNEKEYIDKILDLRAQLEAANRERDNWKSTAKTLSGNVKAYEHVQNELKTQLEASEREREALREKYEPTGYYCVVDGDEDKDETCCLEKGMNPDDCIYARELAKKNGNPIDCEYWQQEMTVVKGRTPR